MKPSKLFFFATGLVLCVLLQNTRTVLADGAIAPQPVSHGQRGAISSPSGVTATWFTQPRWPVRTVRGRPSGMSHRRTVPSVLPLARIVRLELKARERTSRVWPSRVVRWYM